MFSSYFKVILRNLRKNALFSFINIFGLAIGMACAILILLWVQDELSFDSFNKNAPNLYRVVENQYYAGGEIFPVAVTPGPLAKSLKDNYPEIINSTRFSIRGRTLRYGDKIFNEEVAFADPAFIKMFTYPLAGGNPDNAMVDLHSILLTKKSAEKYFGNENPLGKTIMINDSLSLKITGILNEVPENSHLHFDCLIPFEFFKVMGSKLDNWNNNSFYTYIQLQPNAITSEVDKKIKDEIKRHNEGSTTEINLQPLNKIHLYSGSKYAADIGGHGNIEYVNIFSLVALIVLFIACINFMNLSTARATKRAKEVGMRKVIGAGRLQIIKQFYFESILFAVIALIIALIISDLILNPFHHLAGKEISFNSLGSTMLAGLITLTILTGLIAGSYPAIYLSSFLPVKVLKSDSVVSGGGSLFRKVLVVVQFSLSLILIIGTIIISNQLNYIKNKDIGFNRENIIEININKTIRNNLLAVKNELKQNPDIVSVGAGSASPAYVMSSSSGFDWPGKNKDDRVLIHFISGDEDFVTTFKMKMVQGRFYSKDFGSYSSSIVLNEEAAKVIGIKDPIGRTLTMSGDKFTITGVVKNFNFKPMDTKIEPLVIYYDNGDFYSMFARLKPGDLPGTINYIKRVYKKFSPSAPFNYHFLDEDFDNLYKSETRMQTIFEYFAIFAIIISCLGLFGLASYIAERRTKEIGIRKVLGANIINLTYLLSLEFTKWVLISNLIAWPVAYYFMNKWLQGFAYRTELSLWVFPLSGLLVLLVALLTVSYQAIKAALINPVKSLKYE